MVKDKLVWDITSVARVFLSALPCVQSEPKYFFVNVCERSVICCVASQNMECGYLCGLYGYLPGKIHTCNQFKFLSYIVSTVFQLLYELCT